MSTFKYAEAGLEDLDGLLEIEARCFRSDHLKRRQMRYLLAEARAFCLLCKSAAGVHGYLLCLTPALPRPARVYSLAVMPELRGQGIASTLLSRALKKIHRLGYRRCRLEVRVKDKKAQALYRHFNFNTLEYLPAYYEDSADGIRMELELKPVGASS